MISIFIFSYFLVLSFYFLSPPSVYPAFSEARCGAARHGAAPHYELGRRSGGELLG